MRKHNLASFRRQTLQECIGRAVWMPEESPGRSVPVNSNAAFARIYASRGSMADGVYKQQGVTRIEMHFDRTGHTIHRGGLSDTHRRNRHNNRERFRLLNAQCLLSCLCEVYRRHETLTFQVSKKSVMPARAQAMIATVRVQAPCAPTTRHCSISAVFEGPEINTP